MSTVIQRAVRNTLASQTPALRLLVKSLEITKKIRGASDEALERIQHTGDLALRHCLFEYVCRSPVEIPCGYLKAVQSEIFSTTSLALLVARSDLDVESAPRTASQIVYLIFGVLSRDLGGHRLQHTFDLLFDPLLCAADAAYLACCDETASTELQRRRHRKPDEVKTGKFTGARDFLALVDSSEALTVTSALLDPPPLQRSLGPIVSEFCENLAQDLDDFLAMVPSFPGAFMTGFRSAFEEPTSSSRPFTGPVRTRPATPQRAPKPYQRAGAISPPSHRRCRLLPSLKPVAKLASVPRRRKTYPPTYSA
ncbi:hypothetical protein B0H14DRAFT_3515792 [Mycena olivaceomarginata]|nr:hypothetical protein B0H14DRAFT_3515792 [Mycena olivaceomarginata]